MPIYIKDSGSYQTPDDVYVKDAGVWKIGQQTFLKDAGIWKLAQDTIATPPPAPILSVHNEGNLYFQVGVALPGFTHRTDIRLIRVLVSQHDTPFPPSPVGSTGYFGWPYTNVANGVEGWSDWYYNDLLPSGNGGFYPTGRVTNSFSLKNFSSTLPYKTGSHLGTNSVYRFIAWAQNTAGQWGPPTTFAYKTGSNTPTSDHSQFYRLSAPALSFGTMSDTDSSYTEGRGTVSAAPNKMAVANYGTWLNAFVNSGLTLKSAYILLFRAPDDPLGPSSSKAYAQWHNGASDGPGVYIPPGARTEAEWLLNQASAANAMARGQAVYKDVPASWLNNLDTGIKGIVLQTNPSDTVNTTQTFSSLAETGGQQAMLTLSYTA